MTNGLRVLELYKGWSKNKKNRLAFLEDQKTPPHQISRFSPKLLGRGGFGRLIFFLVRTPFFGGGLEWKKQIKKRKLRNSNSLQN